MLAFEFVADAGGGVLEPVVDGEVAGVGLVEPVGGDEGRDEVFGGFVPVEGQGDGGGGELGQVSRGGVLGSDLPEGVEEADDGVARECQLFLEGEEVGVKEEIGLHGWVGLM